MVGDRSPFCDPLTVRDVLYASPDRLARRTDALHRAKRSGRHAAHVIATLADEAMDHRGQLAAVEIGCGRGTTSRVIGERLTLASLTLLDISAPLLMTARERLRATLVRAQYARADFHAIPLRDGACQLVIAAFCLYHSRQPQAVIKEISRCLAPGGIAILVTKSVDSYRELDQLVAASGLDPEAASRPSLYATAHSGNLEALAERSLTVRRVLHDEHTFRFDGFGHLAEYLVTSPKFTLPEGLHADPVQLAAALRRHLPDSPVVTTSTVTYLVGTTPSHNTGALR